MQLKLTTDYTIRCVLYLSLHQGSASAEEIGKAMGITPNYAQRILQKLKNSGMVYSIQGNGGGYVLARKPEDIRMIDVISLEEKTIRINRCLEDDHYCSRNGVAENCPVHSYYEELQGILMNYLGSTTIYDLIHQEEKQKAEAGEISVV